MPVFVSFAPSRLAEEDPLFQFVLEPSKQGALLVAAPDLKNSPHEKSVVLVIQDTEKEVFGFILNQPLVKFLPQNRAYAQLNYKGVRRDGTPVVAPGQGGPPAFLGGSVSVGQFCCLHSGDHRLPDTASLGSGIYMSFDHDLLQRIIDGQGPKQSRIVTGLTRWSAGELAEELDWGKWLLMRTDSGFVFETPYASLWDEAVALHRSPRRAPFHRRYIAYNPEAPSPSRGTH